MKKLLKKIKSLNTSQAIVLGAVIIALAYLISNNASNVSNIFCGEKCENEKISNARSCAKFARRYARETSAKIKNDVYEKCLGER